MRTNLKKFLKSKNAKFTVTDVVVSIAILFGLVPVISAFVGAGDNIYTCDLNFDTETNENYTVLAQDECINPFTNNSDNVSATNIGTTTTETTLLGLTVLFLVLGFVFTVAKGTGLIKRDF